MQFDAVLLPPRRAESIARGSWHDRTTAKTWTPVLQNALTNWR